MASRSDVETEKVKCVGTCNNSEFDFGMEVVVSSPNPPPIILGPASTFISFVLRKK